MEARVDVRKLQILNDRINQTIDALNQVRFSVHGLGQTGGGLQQGFGGGLQQGFGGLGHTGGFQTGFGGGMSGLHGMTGLSQGYGFQGIPGFSTGLQHSPFMNPYTVNPYATLNPNVYPQWSLGQNPFGHSPFGTFGQGSVGQTPWGVGGNLGGFGGGLFHSSPDILEQRFVEVRAADPFRLTQTFPFIVT